MGEIKTERFDQHTSQRIKEKNTHTPHQLLLPASRDSNTPRPPALSQYRILLCPPQRSFRCLLLVELDERMGKGFPPSVEEDMDVEEGRWVLEPGTDLGWSYVLGEMKQFCLVVSED